MDLIQGWNSANVWEQPGWWGGVGQRFAPVALARGPAERTVGTE